MYQAPKLIQMLNMSVHLALEMHEEKLVDAHIQF